jgi:hypothetical protein
MVGWLELSWIGVGRRSWFSPGCWTTTTTKTSDDAVVCSMSHSPLPTTRHRLASSRQPEDAYPQLEIAAALREGCSEKKAADHQHARPPLSGLVSQTNEL